VGQTIVLHDPNGRDFEFVIVSVLPSQYYPNAFLVRRDYLEDTYKARGGIGYAARLVVRVDTAENLGAVARAIDERYRNSEAETRSETESELLAGAFARIGSIRAIIFSLVAVVIVTVLLIAGNAMAMTVRERIPEVALLRTLGFSRARIGCLLLGEAALLGLIGGLLGALTAFALFAGGADMGSLTSGLGLISVTPTVAIVTLLVAIVVSVVAGTLPIVSALQTAPAVALRKPG
jgi:putative ABC transport system permease protein